MEEKEVQQAQHVHLVRELEAVAVPPSDSALDAEDRRVLPQRDAAQVCQRRKLQPSVHRRREFEPEATTQRPLGSDIKDGLAQVYYTPSTAAATKPPAPELGISELLASDYEHQHEPESALKVFHVWAPGNEG